MKKTFDFQYEEEKYVLKDTNPNDKRVPFSIDCSSLEFNCQNFYDYVFSDITEKFEIVVNKSIKEDNIPEMYRKQADRVYQHINQICTEVIEEMNKLYE